jgi:hypothetical protein
MPTLSMLPGSTHLVVPAIAWRCSAQQCGLKQKRINIQSQSSSLTRPRLEYKRWDQWEELLDGSNTSQMAANVICKCEKVTELEVVRAMRRSLPIDSSQGIRKRTRAGMGHCQGDPDNYNCEARVRAIIARENGVPIEQVGGRPWPATSTLSQRWIDDKEKHGLEERKNKN